MWESLQLSGLSHGSSSQFGFKRRTPSILLRLSLKLSFFIKLTVWAGSGDPEPSLSYAARSSHCCCRTSCDEMSTSSLLTSFHSPNIYAPLQHVITFLHSRSFSLPPHALFVLFSLIFFPFDVSSC